MDNEFSGDVVARGIWQRIARDSLVSQESDLFWPYRETRTIVPYLIPMMCPPSLTMRVSGSTKCPDYDDVREFLNLVSTGCNIPTECCVIALIYIDRLRCLVNLKIVTWKIVLLSALSLAIKMWEDSPRHWPLELSLATDISEFKICGAEHIFCQIIDFHLHIDGEEYKQYYSLLFKPSQFRPIKSRP